MDLRGLILWDVEDVPAEIVSTASAAALAKLDELRVSPLEAVHAMFNIQHMDDCGALFSEEPGFEPDYAKFGVVSEHLDAHHKAVDAARKVLQEQFPARATQTIAIGISEEALAEWHARGIDQTKAG
jgi:hypothetical protein